jgi:hypothetical protein
MAKYLVLYRSSVPATEQMAAGSPEDTQAGMELWMQWAGRAGDAIVDMGSPLSSTGVVGGPGQADKAIGGYSILEADSPKALAKLLDGHPHLHSPGDPSIETLEFLPIPGT